MQLYVFPRADSAPTPWIAPIFSRFHVNVCNERSSYPLHNHAGDFEVIIVDRGSYHCLLNNEPLTLKPGEILVVKPGDSHADTYLFGLRFFTIYFHIDIAFLGQEAAFLFRSTVSPRQQRVRVDRRIFWSIFHRLQEESGAQDHFAAHVQDHLLGEFFWRLVRALPAEAIHPEFIGFSEKHLFRTELQRLFQERIHEQLSIVAMARHLHMSERSLFHKCKTLFRQSPAQLFMRCKMERAQFLLRNTDLRVKDISASFGFKNQYHFSRIFKKYVGQAPAVCRQPS